MSKNLRSGVSILFLLAAMAGHFANAQDITETYWYFGNSSYGFVFDKNGRTPTLRDDQATSFGTTGSAVISDPETGNLLFYSDGEVIYDASHQILPGMGASRLNGDLSKIQPVVSSPVPGSTSRYFFFTNSGSEINYSIVDASQLGNSAVSEFPLGDLESINQTTALTDVGPLLKIIPVGDEENYWLITQDADSYDLQVSAVSASGIDVTTTYDVFPDSIPTFLASAIALKTDSTGESYLALSPVKANRNLLILNFDLTTGSMTFEEQITNSAFDDDGSTVIYDLEWSEDGSKLYYSRTGDDSNGGNLYQIDFTDTTSTQPVIADVLSSSVYRSYGLRRGLDGNIYHLYQESDSTSPFSVGRISVADSTASAGLTYEEAFFDADFQGMQFPEFAPPYTPATYFTMSFTYLDSCLTGTTKFIPQVSPLPNSYYWDFGDGSTGEGPAPIHEYSDASGYFVTLTAELNGLSQSVSLPVEILSSDSVDLGNDTTICVDETLELNAGSGGVYYLWSTGVAGASDSTITVDTAGVYWVAVTWSTGCTSYDEIQVTEYGVTSQKYNQWYFGEYAGLDFNTGTAVAITDDNKMFSAEGCATISDDNGQLLFYTNGSTVWNKDHKVMINGTNIGGDSTAAQSAMIMPFPDERTMFYIFTTEEVYGDYDFELKMSIVNLKKDSARGQVMIKNIPIIYQSSEKVTATGFTGTPWLLTHEYGNFNFRAYQISDAGIGSAVHSAVGKSYTFQEELEGTGYLKFSPDTDHAAAIIPGATNYVNLLDFDTTGALTNARLLDIEETDPAYGIEFSSDGTKLYVSTSGSSSKVLQYDLDSIDSDNAIAIIQSTKYAYPTTLPNYGALQMGPDGVIYIAIDETTQLATISDPDGDDADASFTEMGIDLLGRTSRLGLPNFTQEVGSSGQTPSISVDVACAGNTTYFSGTGRDSSIETYQWDFGDGTVTGWLSSADTSHVYTIDSTYIVTLTLSNRCDVDTVLTDTVVVYTVPPTPDVPTDTVLCGSSVTLYAWPEDVADYNYYWSTGDTTRAVTFSSPTIVQVAIYTDEGCASDTATVYIGQDETDLDLGADQTICQYDSLVLDSDDPGPNYIWTINGVEVGYDRTQTVYTDTAGTYEYTVSVWNDYTECVYSDTVEITVQAGPKATQTNVVNPECGEANGSFSLEIDTDGSYSYAISGPVSSGPYTFDGPGTTDAVTDLSSGSYVATITNTVTGCSTTEVIQLEDNADFDMEASAVNQCAHTGQITLTFSGEIPSQVLIDVLNADGSNVYSATETLTSSKYKITDLDTGSYYVQVEQVESPYCIQTDTVHLTISEDCYLSIFVPNAFSPNGNGMNEEWFAYPNEYIDEFKVYVFNRWGELVYYSTDKNFSWDGTNKGQQVPVDTYAYKMVFTSTLEDGEFTQYGSVTVIK